MFDRWKTYTHTNRRKTIDICNNDTHTRSYTFAPFVWVTGRRPLNSTTANNHFLNKLGSHTRTFAQIRFCLLYKAISPSPAMLPFSLAHINAVKQAIFIYGIQLSAQLNQLLVGKQHQRCIAIYTQQKRNKQAKAGTKRVRKGRKQPSKQPKIWEERVNRQDQTHARRRCVEEERTRRTERTMTCVEGGTGGPVRPIPVNKQAERPANCTHVAAA